MILRKIYIANLKIVETNTHIEKKLYYIDEVGNPVNPPIEKHYARIVFNYTLHDESEAIVDKQGKSYIVIPERDEPITDYEVAIQVQSQLMALWSQLYVDAVNISVTKDDIYFSEAKGNVFPLVDSKKLELLTANYGMEMKVFPVSVMESYILANVNTMSLATRQTLKDIIITT